MALSLRSPTKHSSFPRRWESRIKVSFALGRVHFLCLPTNSSGMNLDAESARRVRGMDASNQIKRTKRKGTPCAGLRLPDKNTYLREIEKLAIAQTFRFLILREAFLPAAQKGISGADLNIHSPIALMRSRASQSCSDKHDGCLSAATNLYGTNLDVLGARKVSGLDATNQFTVMPEQIEKRR